MEESLEKVLSLMEETGKLFNGYTPHDGLGWNLGQLHGLMKILKKYLPVKEGDRVILLEDVKCEGNWESCSHFLKKGEVATINSIEIYKENLFVNLVFDNETYIDKKGIEQPVSCKHTFYFPIESVVKIKEKNRTENNFIFRAKNKNTKSIHLIYELNNFGEQKVEYSVDGREPISEKDFYDNYERI